MQKKWLYTLVAISTLAGLSWVSLNLQRGTFAGNNRAPDVCMFHRITGLPCPSCGSTHSILHIAHLEFNDAFYANPIGFLLAAAMICFPFWILYDVALRKSTFYNFYNMLEIVMRKRWVAATLITLVTVNWIWNIYKFA